MPLRIIYTSFFAADSTFVSIFSVQKAAYIINLAYEPFGTLAPYLLFFQLIQPLAVGLTVILLSEYNLAALPALHFALFQHFLLLFHFFLRSAYSALSVTY